MMMMDGCANGISLLIRLFLPAIILANAISRPHLFEVEAPTGGILQGYCVRRGQKIGPGTVVAIVESARHMEILVRAPSTSSWDVLELPLWAGLPVQGKDCLVSLRRHPSNDPKESSQPGSRKKGPSH